MSYQHFSAIYNNIKVIILLELIWEQVCKSISRVGKFYDLPTQGDIKVLAQSQYTTNKHTTPRVTLKLHLVNYLILCSLNTKYQARKLDLKVICIPHSPNWFEPIESHIEADAVPLRHKGGLSHILWMNSH